MKTEMVSCPECGKELKKQGLGPHLRLKHGIRGPGARSAEPRSKRRYRSRSVPEPEHTHPAPEPPAHEVSIHYCPACGFDMESLAMGIAISRRLGVNGTAQKNLKRIEKILK